MLVCFAVACAAVWQERDITVVPRTLLVEVRGPQRQAMFHTLGPSGQPVSEAVMQYDMLHVTPPHGPAEAVAASALANVEGWVEVDSETLQVSTALAARGFHTNVTSL